MDKSVNGSFNNENSAISPVFGVMLMLLITVLLAGVTVTAVYGNLFPDTLGKAPMAVIGVEHVEGGVPNAVGHRNVAYGRNFMCLVHKGGDPLSIGSTKIIISGEGSSYAGVVPSGTWHYGEVLVCYESLAFDGKTSQYASENPELSDGLWSAGERLILNGDDSIDGSSASSVQVSINEVTNTANNYGFFEESKLTIKIFDEESNCIISECECVVIPAK